MACITKKSSMKPQFEEDTGGIIRATRTMTQAQDGKADDAGVCEAKWKSDKEQCI